MKFYDQLAPVLIGVTIALVQTQAAVALSPTEVNQIAKQITVLIQIDILPPLIRSTE
jgi:hypothetical protein